MLRALRNSSARAISIARPAKRRSALVGPRNSGPSFERAGPMANIRSAERAQAEPDYVGDFARSALELNIRRRTIDDMSSAAYGIDGY